MSSHIVNELDIKEAAAFLKSAERASNCRLLRGSLRRRTFRTLARLWECKRPELNPKDELPPLVRREGTRNLFNEAPLMKLRDWLTMPAGHYGTEGTERRDTQASAAYVGCDKATILNRVREGRLSVVEDWSRNGKGKINTFFVSELKALKMERDADEGKGKLREADGTARRSLKGAADLTGIPLSLLIGAIRRPGRAEVLQVPIPETLETRKQKIGGIETETLSETEAWKLANRIKKITKMKKPTGYAEESELADEFNLTSRTQRIELGECLRCWREKKESETRPRLPVKFFYVEKERSTGRRRKTARHLLRVRLYHVATARRLWAETCSAAAGAELLRDLVKPGDKVSIESVKEQMREAGFVGHRFGHARRLARVRRVASGAVTQPWDYERAPERPKDAVSIIAALLANGPIKVEDGDREARASGLRHGEIKRALAALGIRSRPAGAQGAEGLGTRPWYWCLPDQEPPKLSAVGVGPETHKAAAASNRKAQETTADAINTAFVCSPLQRGILDALNGKAKTADELETMLHVDRRRLFYGGTPDGAGGLRELCQKGLVRAGKGRHSPGYWRPDCPPLK